MFTTVLTCNPTMPVLDAATIEALRNAWGGGDARWLAGGVAAEFDMPDRRDPAEARVWAWARWAWT